MNLVEFASELAKRHLGDQGAETLRSLYRRGSNRLSPLLRVMYGTFGTDDLRRHLEERVGRDFEILMVHSSVNGMRPMFTGTPLELVRMLIDFCGPDRTLAMPAFYFGEDGKGAYPTFVKTPRFDIQRTPSQMGLATELFRRTPGVRQSRHPVYRVAAIGPLAEELLAGHELTSSPAGRGSPFEFMTRHRTCIIGIGKTIEVLTQAHHTEELMGDEFPVPSRPGTAVPITLIDRGREIPFELRGRWVDGRFNIWRIRKIMSRAALQEWTFHHVPMFATTASEVTRQLVEAARRGITLYEPN